MEATGNGAAAGGGDGNEAQLLISGVGGDQPLVMSAEDAAQFLAQAGLQLADVTDSGEQVIINSDALQNAAAASGIVKVRLSRTSFLHRQLLKKCFSGGTARSDFEYWRAN